jgi:hypothetical protein
MNYYNTELFHSETYLGADYSDGLKHFKYIKRYRNARGKWVYVYANKTRHNQIQRDLHWAKEYRHKQDRDAMEADAYDRARWLFNPKTEERSELGDSFYKEAVEGSQRAHGDVYKDRENAEAHESAAWNTINQYSLNRLAKEKVDKGTSIINNLFSKLRKGGK